MLLRRVSAAAAATAGRHAVDDETLSGAAAILRDIEARGESAARAHAERLGDLAAGTPLVLGPAELRRSLGALPAADRGVLERTAERIARFAQAQKDSLRDVDVPIAGGRAGHRVTPVERAGCYAPGGRFPLPSSVLMTAVTARVAGVRDVVVASPRPAPATLAAAAIAGADAFLAIGGAQAIGVFAYGLSGGNKEGRSSSSANNATNESDTSALAPRDIIVGPGNRWVTAAKQLVAGRVAIDMLAGPSELVVLADASADAAIIAADLLAQAEHDTDAVPILVTTDAALIDRVDIELARQLAALPTAGTARAALANGFAALAATLDEAIALCDRLAPEHLEVLTADAQRVADRLRHFGGLFIGASAAEVLGDYGAGPNHVLPTGGTARFAGGLSVLTFLKVRTWMRVDDRRAAQELVKDAAALGRIEGLEGHARSAETRRA